MRYQLICHLLWIKKQAQLVWDLRLLDIFDPHITKVICWI